MCRRMLVLTMGLIYTLSANAGMQLLWGDTHVHSSYSTDSFLNQNFTLDPDAAYRFARGLPVVHPTTGARVQIETPLDFLVVADHAESLGTMRKANQEGLPRDGLGPVDWVKSWVTEKMFRFMAGNPDSIVKLLEYASPDTDSVVEAAKTPASISMPNDALALNVSPQDTGHPVSIQERAYTSPIHYRP